MLRIEEGDDFGWPYCYYDGQLERKVLAPEYGGDGEVTGRCAEKKDPVAYFPGHWGPHAIIFYEADAFPEHYRGGAFIAFHGSWNRAPLPQGGYNVVFLPFANGEPGGDWEVFADGFAGADVSPSGAAHRPAGLAVGPDGALYVSDDSGGRIWRIVHAGG
jgi:glucose/arabinose dehydrogenase